MPATPIATTADLVTALQQELGDIVAARSAAYAAGIGPTYSISGANGSESVGMLDYIKWLGEREIELAERLQELQPFLELRRVRVGGSLLS